jgi:prepilin-type N-terminal cleavage/methylation domain-containing protein
MAKFAQHQRGFTLIEMSIVLVIIGLIVGGILKGQELIESSRQKSYISQIDRLKAGTTSFVDRFKGLPGDITRITLLPNSGLLAAGDANGVVDQDATPATTVAGIFTNSLTLADEQVEFFNHLQAAGLGSNGSVTNVQPTCYAGLCGTASPLPSSSFQQSGINISYGTHPGLNTPATPMQRHWLTVTRFVNGAANTSHAVLSGERAFQIDNKYDDGISQTGNIRSDILTADCGTNAASYNASETDIQCMLAVSLE